MISRLVWLFFVILPLFCYGSNEKRHVTIADISSDNIVSLVDGGKVELAGIFIPPEMQKKAAEFIKNTYINQDVGLYFGVREKNRHGNYYAQVKGSSGWLQGQLLEQGLAFAYPTFDNDLMVSEMLSAEAVARDSKSGIWAAYSIVSAAEAVGKMAGLRNKFAIIEGEVVLVKKTKDITYINFGNDWKSDFTAAIRKENYKQFPNLDVLSLQGKKIRVRGWVEAYNGPFIEVYSILQVEVF